jgi:uncharacterized protein YfcZ (UPF0381/DUF406 family)
MPQLQIGIVADPTNAADMIAARSLFEAIETIIIKSREAPSDLSEVHEATAAPEQPAETVAARRTRRARDADADKSNVKEFVVYKPDGERHGGFTHSKDAAEVLIFDVQQLTTKAETDGFGKYNISTIAQLDKTDQQRVQEAIAAHVSQLKAAEAAKAKEVDPLAAAFGLDTPAEAPLTPLTPMTKDDFIKQMLAIAGALGPQASKAWMTSIGFAGPKDVPADRYAEVVAAGQAHIKKLRGE